MCSEPLIYAKFGQKISGPFTIAHYFLLIVYYFSPIVKKQSFETGVIYDDTIITRICHFSRHPYLLSVLLLFSFTRSCPSFPLLHASNHLGLKIVHRVGSIILLILHAFICVALIPFPSFYPQRVRPSSLDFFTVALKSNSGEYS